MTRSSPEGPQIRARPQKGLSATSLLSPFCSDDDLAGFAGAIRVPNSALVYVARLRIEQSSILLYQCTCLTHSREYNKCKFSEVGMFEFCIDSKAEAFPDLPKFYRQQSIARHFVCFERG